MDNIDNICKFCTREFSCKTALVNHQRTVKSCLKLQGKQDIETFVECPNCKKKLAVRSFKQHKVKCDMTLEEQKKHQEESHKTSLLEKENKELKEDIESLKLEIVEYKTTILLLREQNENFKEQNEKLQSISTNVTMKLVDKANTVNNHNKTVVINAPLTNEVLRQCATTFTLDNAYNIDGITKHLTSSLEDHITCTDPSRNIFKYKNEKEEEIVDKDLEILLPQYLIAVKDRNNFLYKEVFEYFKKNNVSLNEQTDYTVFYQALNDIIKKTGQQNKYTEKYKQYMVRECKRQFLEKNKKKEKNITKQLTDEEIMMNIIETGGSLHDYIIRAFPDYMDNEETEEQFNYRRSMEDVFREKKREWKEKQKNI